MMIEERYVEWQKGIKDESLRLELQNLTAEERKERFYKELSFGTGGLRGVLGVGTACLNVYTVARITRGVAAYLLKKGLPQKVAISYDSRIYSQLFAQTAARVFAQNGIVAVLTPELMPTPFLSYLTREIGAGLGVMITASHNPKEYNGYKVYGTDGCQVTDVAAGEIAREIQRFGYFEQEGECFEIYQKNGLICFADEKYEREYLDKIKQMLAFPLDKISIVYTPLHGTGYRIIPKLLQEVSIGGLTIVQEQGLPDGKFPTCPAPNPEKAEALALGVQTLEKSDCDLLIATDPDADRIGVVVKKGDKTRLLTGNETGALLCEYLLFRKKERGELSKNDVVVKTIVTTDLVEKICQSYGVRVKDTLTGFKYIGEQVGELEKFARTSDFVLGLEESYGYLVQTFVRDKDAVSAALKIAEMAAYYKTKGATLWDKLEEIYARYGRYENKLKTYAYPGADGAKRLRETVVAIRNNPPKRLGQEVVAVKDYLSEGTGLPKADVLSYALSNGGKVLIRPSGTEPLIKAYLFVCGDEKSNAETIKNMENDLEKILYS